MRAWRGQQTGDAEMFPVLAAVMQSQKDDHGDVDPVNAAQDIKRMIGVMGGNGMNILEG